jgi:sporulation protein YlmC with PRC-barrel domain
MTKTAIVAAFAALLAASPMALAQTQPQTQTQPESTAGMPAAGNTAIQGKLKPDQVLASNLKGSEVYDSANQKVGTVKDIVIGEDGHVVAVVLDADNRNVAVGMQDLKIAKGNGGSNDIQKVTLNVSQAQLKAAPPVDLNAGTGSSTGGNAAGGNVGAGGGGTTGGK